MLRQVFGRRDTYAVRTTKLVPVGSERDGNNKPGKLAHWISLSRVAWRSVSDVRAGRLARRCHRLLGRFLGPLRDGLLSLRFVKRRPALLGRFDDRPTAGRAEFALRLRRFGLAFDGRPSLSLRLRDPLPCGCAERSLAYGGSLSRDCRHGFWASRAAYSQLGANLGDRLFYLRLLTRIPHQNHGQEVCLYTRT